MIIIQKNFLLENLFMTAQNKLKIPYFKPVSKLYAGMRILPTKTHGRLTVGFL